MSKLNEDLDKENIVDKLEGLDQKWKVIVQKGNTKVLGLYKNYVGWEEDELAEIRIKFDDDDDD